MNFVAAAFDWDHGNRDKCLSHGVSVPEIESIFRGPVDLFPDRRHSRAEQRLKAIGRSKTGRHVFIVFTLRKRGDVLLIRPISARYMHGKEIRHYEKQKAEIEEAPNSQDR